MKFIFNMQKTSYNQTTTYMIDHLHELDRKNSSFANFGCRVAGAICKCAVCACGF